MRDSLFWIVAVGPEKIAILGLSAMARSAATSSMGMNNERKGKAMSDICYPPNKMSL